MNFITEITLIRVLGVKVVQGSYSRCLDKIWCKSVQKWRSYCRLTDFKMAAAALGFLHYVNFDGKSVCGTPFCNLCLKFGANACNNGRVMAKKCDFQYGGRRHLGFCRIWVLRVKVVLGPYSRCLCQIWCKSVRKWRSYGRLTVFKMAAAAILNLLPVSIFIIWSSFGSGCECSCKISHVYVNVLLTY